MKDKKSMEVGSRARRCINCDHSLLVSSSKGVGGVTVETVTGGGSGGGEWNDGG